MKREFWAIGNTFGYAIRILNSIFCSDEKKEQEYSEKEMWLVAEQINSMCSKTMLEDVEVIIGMINNLPDKRLCEKIDCVHHHSTDSKKEICDLCSRCSQNKKSRDF